MSGKEIIKLLQQNGWIVDRICGSHHIMKKEGRILSVPIHGKKDIRKGTLHKLMKAGGLKE